MQKSLIEFFLAPDGSVHENIKMGEDYERHSDEGYAQYVKLVAILNEEQKEQFEKYVDAELDLMCESNDIYFREGMKYGMRLAVECLFD